MTVTDAIQTRRSIRRYLPDEVPATALSTILEAARLAPSGCNCQPWRFIVVREAADRERLAEEAMTLPANAVMCRQAPVVIACLSLAEAHCQIPDRVQELAAVNPEFAAPTIAKRTGRVLKSRFDNMTPEQRGAYMDLNTTIALTQMMLQATELGYGMCWLKAYDGDAVRKVLELPPEARVVALSPLGRPAESPSPRPRLDLREIAYDGRFGAPLEL